MNNSKITNVVIIKQGTTDMKVFRYSVMKDLEGFAGKDTDKDYMLQFILSYTYSWLDEGPSELNEVCPGFRNHLKRCK